MSQQFEVMATMPVVCLHMSNDGITFHVNGDEVPIVQLCSDGQIRIRGELCSSNNEVYLGLLEFVRAGHSAREQELLHTIRAMSKSARDSLMTALSQDK
jgi:hypothetical protein